MNPERPPYLTHDLTCDLDEDCSCEAAELRGNLAEWMEHATRGTTVVEVEGARAGDHEVDRFIEGVRWSDAQIRALTKLLGRDVVDSGSLTVEDVHRLKSAGYAVENAHGGVVIRPPSGSRKARRAKASRAKRSSRKRR